MHGLVPAPKWYRFLIEKMFPKHLNLENFLMVGAQNQTLILLAIEGAGAEKEASKPKRQQQSKKFALTPKAVFRGHQRSVESVAVNGDGFFLKIIIINERRTLTKKLQR